MTRAYDGIKILDFTQVLSGPISTFQLGLLGAQVIKVEPPDKGDMCRPLLDPTQFGKGFLSPFFIGANLNKRSIVVDLKHPDAKALLEPLVRDADVIVQNFRPGVIDRLGFGYDAVKALRSDIVYCAISGYGQTGPDAKNAAFDGAIQAASGLMASNGHEETGPTRTVSPVIDVSTGLMAAFAISSALLRRARTGEGQFIDVAMLDTAVMLLNPVFNLFLATGQEPELLGNQSIAKLPTTNVFPTGDGHVQITALTDDQVSRLCHELGCQALLDEPRFATSQARVENRDAMREHLVAILATETTAVWLQRLSAAGVPSAPVATLPEVLGEAQLEHRHLTIKLPAHPSMDADTVESVTTGFITDADGPHAHSMAPMLGEHTREVLSEYGYDASTVNAMVSDGLVQVAD
ncbi:MAG: CoA transferase [Chromatiales bacterium]|jgi:crotonobetainyl-CoA:carnitine CoA-transferase CaiB-like acyl-CoA transferase|nr:CoA transferase [Chromatiales bacterium]